MKTATDYYRQYRRDNPELPAHIALSWSRHSVTLDQLASEAEWTFDRLRYPLIACAQFDGYSIRVYSDDEVYDWGDVEPTEYERNNLEVIGVALRIDGASDDLDSVWGYGYIDDDSEREALSCALQHGMVDVGRRERSERESWAARDVMTEVER